MTVTHITPSYNRNKHRTFILFDFNFNTYVKTSPQINTKHREHNEN